MLNSDDLEAHRLGRTVTEHALKRLEAKKEKRHEKSIFKTSDSPEKDVIRLGCCIQTKHALMKDYLIQAKELEIEIHELTEIKHSLEATLVPTTYASFPKRSKGSKIDKISDAELLEMAKDGRLEEMIKKMAEDGILHQIKE